MPRDRKALLERARRVRAIALDVDGVLTDAGLVYGPRGDSAKSFSARDGFAIRLAQGEGIQVAVLTGRTSAAVRSRVADLGIPAALSVQGSRDKGADLGKLARRLGVGLDAIAFMGDDLPDLPALSLAGLAACPSDAVEEVRARCAFVAESAGGRGAVRDLVRLLLEARGRWAAIVEAWADGTAPSRFFAPGPARPVRRGRGAAG